MKGTKAVQKGLVIAGATGFSFFIPLIHQWLNAALGFHGLRLETAFFWIFLWLFIIDFPWLYLPAGAVVFSVYLVGGESPVLSGGLLFIQILLLRGFKRRFFLDVYPTQVFFSFWVLLGSYALWFLAFYPPWHSFALGVTRGWDEGFSVRFYQLGPAFFVFYAALAAYNALVGSLLLQGGLYLCRRTRLWKGS